MTKNHMASLYENIMLLWWHWVLIAVAAATVIGILVWGFAFDGFGLDDDDDGATTSTTTTTTGRFKSSNVSSRNAGTAQRTTTTIVIHDADVPTDAQGEAYGLQGDLNLYRVVVITQPDTVFDHEYTSGDTTAYYNFYAEDRDANGHSLIIFVQQSANNLYAVISNVSGVLLSMYITSNEDEFKNGFQPSDFTPQTDLGALVTNLANVTHTMIGAKPGSLLSAGQSTYAFNAKNPVDLSLNTLTDPPTIHADGTYPSTAGGFRIAPQYVDYTYTLNDTEQVLRLFINHPEIPMATKAIRDANGVFQFVVIDDAGNPTLTPTYTNDATILSFWNQPRSLSEWTINDQADIEAQFTQHFRAKVVGIPVSLTNAEDVDMSTASDKVTAVDLHVDPRLSFRDVLTEEVWGQSWTEAELATDYAWQAITFEIPGINFRAEIVFEDA